MKGIILHGGHGTRLRPLTHTGPKQLLPIANKPMSQYALEDLKSVGISDIAIIVGDIYPEKVKEFYGDGSKFGVNIIYIYQDKPMGISHAIRLCKNFVGNDKFIVYLGDNILRKNLTDFSKKFISSNADAMILLCEINDPSRFGVVEFDGNNKIKKIIEKPKNPPSNFAVIGVYFLTPKIFDYIDRLKPSWRNELEITDALQLLLDNGNKLDFDFVSGWWKDTGTPSDILEANKLVLDSLDLKTKSTNENNKTQNIIVGKNTTLSSDTVLKGPLIIAENCKIGPSTKIGPYVSIGKNSVVENSTIENSIIMEDCKISSKIHIYDSIIASGSVLQNSSEPQKHQFMLGERSQIKL